MCGRKNVNPNIKLVKPDSEIDVVDSYAPLNEHERELLKRLAVRSSEAMIIIVGESYVAYQVAGSFTYCYLLSSSNSSSGETEVRIGVTVVSGMDLFNGMYNEQRGKDIAFSRAARSKPIYVS